MKSKSIIDSEFVEIDPNDPSQSIEGPLGAVLELDADQIFPDDPGQGTPALVKFGRETMTFWCATDGNCGDLVMTSPEDAEEVAEWLNSLYDEVSDWLNAQSSRKGPVREDVFSDAPKPTKQSWLHAGVKNGFLSQGTAMHLAQLDSIDDIMQGADEMDSPSNLINKGSNTPRGGPGGEGDEADATRMYKVAVNDYPEWWEDFFANRTNMDKDKVASTILDKFRRHYRIDPESVLADRLYHKILGGLE